MAVSIARILFNSVLSPRYSVLMCGLSIGNIAQHLTGRQSPIAGSDPYIKVFILAGFKENG